MTAEASSPEKEYIAALHLSIQAKERRKRSARRTILGDASLWLHSSKHMTLISHLVGAIVEIVEADTSRSETRLFKEGIEDLEAALCELHDSVELNCNEEQGECYLEVIDAALEKVDEWARHHEETEHALMQKQDS
jgi:thiamine kinase-like enzyme